VLGGGGGTFDRWLGVRNLKLYGCRKVKRNRLAFVQDDVGLVALLHVEHEVPDPLAGQRHLIVGVGVHENEATNFVVDVLDFAVVQVGLLDLVLRSDAIDRDRPRLQILELELENGTPVTGSVKIAVNYVIELAVVPDDYHALANLTVLDRRHKKPPSSSKSLPKSRCPAGRPNSQSSKSPILGEGAGPRLH